MEFVDTSCTDYIKEPPVHCRRKGNIHCQPLSTDFFSLVVQPWSKQEMHQATIKIPRRAILFLLVRATWVLFFMHIPFVMNRTFNTMLTERLQHLQKVWARLFEMTESERDK